jgi:hypothetical protein
MPLKELRQRIARGGDELRQYVAEKIEPEPQPAGVDAAGTAQRAAIAPLLNFDLS